MNRKTTTVYCQVKPFGKIPFPMPFPRKRRTALERKKVTA